MGGGDMEINIIENASARKLAGKDINGMGYELQLLERKLKKGKPVKARKLNHEAGVLKEEILKLRLKELLQLVKDLRGMEFYEVEQVEEELNKVLQSVWAWKDKLMMEQTEQSKVKDKPAVLQNETFRIQVEELRGSRLAGARRAPVCLGYYPEEKKEAPATNISASPDAVGDGGTGNFDSYSNLYWRHYTILVLILSVLFFVLSCVSRVCIC